MAETPAKPRRRWPRFSLRALLAAVTVLCVSIGGALHKAREQRVALAALRQLDDGPSFFFWRVYRIDIAFEDGADPVPTPVERLRKLLGEEEWRNVRSVRAPGSKLVGHDFANLAPLTSLKLLDLGETRVTDSDLMHLRGMSGLNRLRLYKTGITDAGVAHLSALRRIRDLNLSGTKVTDNSLEHLRGRAALEYLSLGGTNVTDNGLPPLLGLARLRQLDLSGTKITDSGLAQLRPLMPNLLLLGLNDTAITDDGLGHLRGFPKNSRVCLVDSRVTYKGAKALKKAVPNLNVVLVTGGGLMFEPPEPPTRKALPYRWIDHLRAEDSPAPPADPP
jgi:hypothetical protein